MAKNLKEKKIEMKNDWENCLELKLEDKLTEKGLKKFWDENTSLEEAEAMLTHAAIDEFVGHLFGSLSGAIIIGVGGCQNEEESEKKEGRVSTPFKILCKGKSLADEFETLEEAEAFVRKQAMETTFTINDFEIVQVHF